MAIITHICQQCQNPFTSKKTKAKYCCKGCSCKAGPHKQHPPGKERFISKINILGEDDCWEWKPGQAHSKDGYGIFWFEKENWYAHKFSFTIFVRQVPEELKVLHKCDNPPCCNPKHLFLGTPGDNAKDRDQKGRQSKGVDRWSAILNEEKVFQILTLYGTGSYTCKILGDLYGVSRHNIYRIIKGQTWKEVFSMYQIRKG